MTDITDQDRRDAREWAEDVAETFKYDDEVPRETRAAVNYILATVDAPAPTLAEELRDLARTLANLAVNSGIEDPTSEELNRLIDRAEQIEQERDYWKGYALDRQREVERLTAERGAATVAREENVAPDQQVSDLPDPADVKPGEAWIVDTERYGRAVAFRSEDGQGSPWKFASKISTGRLLDCAITLVSRLVSAPRQITTREELYELPRRTVIRDADGVTCERASIGAGWYSTDSTANQADFIKYPATVLWTPEEAA